MLLKPVADSLQYLFLVQIGPSGITGTVLIANLLTEKNSLIGDFLQGNPSSLVTQLTVSVSKLVLTVSIPML